MYREILIECGSQFAHDAPLGHGSANATKGRDVHLGVDLCRRRLPVAQQLTNLAQGRAAAKQIGGKGVAQQVSPFELGVQPGTLESAPDDSTDSDRACETLLGSLHPNEYPTRRACRTDVTQIAR